MKPKFGNSASCLNNIDGSIIGKWNEKFATSRDFLDDRMLVLPSEVGARQIGEWGGDMRTASDLEILIGANEMDVRVAPSSVP